MLQHIFNLYDGTDTIFYDYKSLKANAGDNRKNYLKQNDLFYVKLLDYDVIKIELILSLIDNVNDTVDCKIYNAYNWNFLCIKHYKKINLISVNNNLGDIENNIATNLIKINSNEDDILYNLSEINNIKNNISKSYLKNVYNILFYESKTQIDFRKDIFYEKVFDINVGINDFIEINLKFLLEYEYINKANIINMAFKLINDNDKEILVNIHNTGDHVLYKNFVFLNKSIFYNFEQDTKKLKIVIYFRMTENNIVKIWYIPVNTDRMIIKHYGD